MEKRKKSITKSLALILAGILVLVVSVGFTACSKGKGEKPLRVGVAISSDSSSLIKLADSNGYFKKEGVKYILENVDTPYAALNAVLLNKLDINTVALVPTLSLIAQGEDLTIFGGVRSEGGEIITRPENKDNFKDITSLKGAKIAVIHLDTGDYNTRKLLREKGISPNSDIEYIEVDSYLSVTESVKKGAVDYGVITSNMARLAEQQGLVSVQKISDLVPFYVCCRQVALTSHIRENRDEYVKYLKAQIVGYKFFKNQQQETAALLSRLTGLPVEYYITNIYGKDAPLFSPEPAIKKVRDFYELLRVEGVLKTEVDITKHIDSSLFRDAISEIRREFPNEPVYDALYAEFNANN